MRFSATLSASTLLTLGFFSCAAAEDGPQASSPSPSPVFVARDRAVSTWRTEAAGSLQLMPEVAADLLAGRDRPVARCVKLNNYWCIKKAGWTGEIAADAEGHVAFSSAVEGAAVAALLLRRYYVDFGRKSALAIISRWAPAQCGGPVARGPVRTRQVSISSRGLTLRARWLATHARGFAAPLPSPGKTAARLRRSVVADHGPRLAPPPQIALGVGSSDIPVRAITLDALLQSDPRAPRSRSLLGALPGGTTGSSLATTASCSGDGARIAAYAGKAAAGLIAGADGDLGLFDAEGHPTANLATIMTNMAEVEIGPLAATPALIQAGIAEAFKPGRNPSRS